MAGPLDVRGGGRVPAAWLDPEEVLRLEALELRARVVVEGFLAGLHRSPTHGFSVEFSEYRPYAPGDDLRALDWKLLARSDRAHVKRFEDETNLRCHLVLDRSRSMGFAHGGRSPKLAVAVTLAAAIARLLATQRDAVGLVTFDEHARVVLAPRHRPGHLGRLHAALDGATAGEGTALVPALEEVARVATRRGLVVLLSDLLAPLDGLDVALGALRARGHEVLVLRVLDPAELDLPFEEAATFEDLETGRALHVDPASARETYRRRFEAHAAGLTALCADHGIDLAPWRTDRPLAEALVELVHARRRRGRVLARRSRSSAGAGAPRGGRP